MTRRYRGVKSPSLVAAARGAEDALAYFVSGGPGVLRDLRRALAGPRIDWPAVRAGIAVCGCCGSDDVLVGAYVDVADAIHCDTGTPALLVGGIVGDNEGDDPLAATFCQTCEYGCDLIHPETWASLAQDEDEEDDR